MFDQKIIDEVIDKYNWTLAIEYLERKNVNVAYYLVFAFKKHCEIYGGLSMLKLIDLNIMYCPKYLKYKDEVEKYLMLV